MEAIIQILLNSVVSGILLSIIAIGFTYIFKVTGVFHIAHGAIYVSGAFACIWMLAQTSNWFIAISFAFLIVGMLIYLLEKFVYLPLAKKQSNQSISLISSMGIYIIIVNFLAILFGDENKQIDNVILGSFEFGHLNLTKIQAIQSIVGIFVIAALLAYLKISKSNLTLQAMSDNITIAKVFGINTDSQRLKVFIIGSVLACIAAILKALETGIDPQAGMSITLTAAVIAILVSRLNAFLIMIFSIGLTLMQNMIEWWLNAQWKDGITFFILLIVLLFKSEGIISYNLRKDRS